MTINLIQFKRGSKAALERELQGVNNKRPASGEPIFEIDSGSLKIGDGVHDYKDLKYIGGNGGSSGGDDNRFIIQDPVAGQILIYDDNSGKWINKSLADETTITYLSEKGITLKNYENATNGQMLVKDSVQGLRWLDPVSTELLDAKVLQAEQARTDAQTYANTASNKAVEASMAASDANTAAYNAQHIIDYELPEAIDKKMQFMPISEYNAMTTIVKDCFYFLTLE